MSAVRPLAAPPSHLATAAARVAVVRAAVDRAAEVAGVRVIAGEDPALLTAARSGATDLAGGLSGCAGGEWRYCAPSPTPVATARPPS